MDTATSWMGRLKTAWSISSFGERQGHSTNTVAHSVARQQSSCVEVLHSDSVCCNTHVFLCSGNISWPFRIQNPSYMYIRSSTWALKRYSYHLSTHTADIWGVVLVHNKTKQKNPFFWEGMPMIWILMEFLEYFRTFVGLLCNYF